MIPFRPFLAKKNYPSYQPPRERKEKLSDEDVTFHLNPQEVSAIAWMTRNEMLAHPETLEGNAAFVEKFETMLQMV